MLTFAQQTHDEIIKKYLDEEVNFGEFEFLNQSTERLTEEEYEFRKNFRRTYMNFLNDFGKENKLPTSFEHEGITDLMIDEMYIDMFEEFAGMSSSDLTEFASAAKIDPIKLQSALQNIQRFCKGWQDESGGYYRVTWLVNSEGDQVVLYFYLNEQQEIIEFQEDFPTY